MADAWKVGVAIVANTAGIDAALAALGLKMIGLQGKADALGYRFGRMSAMMLGVGSAMVAGGAGMLKIYYDAAKAGDKILQQQAQMKIAGIGAGTVDAVTAQASHLATEIANTTTSGIMETWAKLRPTLGDSEASQALPGTEKILAGLATKYPDIANQAENMFKALDLFGAGMDKTTHKFDANTWNTSLDAMARLMAATHGMINPTMLLQIARMGGVMAQGADFPNFLEQMAAPFMELGSRAGSGLQTVMGEFVGGKVTKRTAEALTEYGLVAPGGITKDHGMYSIAHPEKSLVGGSDMLTKGMGYWVANDVLPALAKHGVDLNNTAQVIQALTKIIGDQRAARVMYTLSTPAGRQQTERDRQQLHQARTQGAPWDTLTSTNLNGALQSVTSAWEDMMEKLGFYGGATRDVTSLMDQLSNAMRRFNSILDTDPDRVNLWVSRFGELGMALVTFGGLTVIGAIARMIGPSGYLFLLGGAIGALSKELGANAPLWEKRALAAGQGAAEGAGVGMMLAGPYGALAGAIVGAIVGGLGEKLPAVLKEEMAAWVSGFHAAADAFVTVITDAKRWEALAMQFGTAILHDMTAGVSGLAAGINHEFHKLVEGAGNAPLAQLQSYHVPEAQHTPIQLISYTQLNGQTIAKTVTNYQAKLLTAPQSGPTGYNFRAGAPSSGQVINA